MSVHESLGLIPADAMFIEQRRRALRRYINMVVNHPVLKDDGALNVFLSESNFEAWRKRTRVSAEEESASKRLNAAEEMAIPADLDEKLGTMREHLPALIASYQKVVGLAERALSRLQAAAADASRLAISVQAIGEETPKCCHKHGCDLCRGVAKGLGDISEGWSGWAEVAVHRVTMSLESVESLKAQRDLHLAFRDLFVRHDSE